VFESLSDRLNGALTGLRGKGRLTDADIDATAREIRLALLEADVSLPVVRAFINRIKERAKGAEVSGALNPASRSSRSSTRNSSGSSVARPASSGSPRPRRRSSCWPVCRVRVRRRWQASSPNS
jgi:signal recognition particle GTPase